MTGGAGMGGAYEEGQRLRTVGKTRAADLAAKRSAIKEAIKKIEIIDPASSRAGGAAGEMTTVPC